MSERFLSIVNIYMHLLTYISKFSCHLYLQSGVSKQRLQQRSCIYGSVGYIPIYDVFHWYICSLNIGQSGPLYYAVLTELEQGRLYLGWPSVVYLGWREDLELFPMFFVVQIVRSIYSLYCILISQLPIISTFFRLPTSMTYKDM